jgi:hypothetical protein
MSEPLILEHFAWNEKPHSLRSGALVASEGFEPPKSMTADLQSDPFGRLGN